MGDVGCSRKTEGILARESLFPFLSGLGGFPGQQPLPKTMAF
jgi:hypothetical protein